ncbi:MAG: M20 family metallopeptidase [Steroidobacteraceae bacterium]|jgi:acetylornithine deacetylase/succinyl-diaminopimelate desuccinylase-like protein|nr:M20 family metallopeptidase [Steroidobacteraceae bacterium]
MNIDRARQLIDGLWAESIVPTLCDYVRIPNKSPNFDADWQAHGYMERAAELLAAWCRSQPIRGMTVEIVRLAGRTPVLLCEVPGQVDDTVLLYGHFDKQPEFTGWADGLSPWEPVIRDGRLYGRGGADDGYAVFASLAAIRALQEQGLPHARCVVLIEGCEESGSVDLPYYVEALSDRIGTPSLVVCLDAECGNYEQFWCTTSLRGNLTGTLSVKVLTEGVHSGAGTGIAPSAFRILRALLDRVESATTGDVLVESLHVPVPAERLEQARAAAGVLGDNAWRRLPFAAGVQPLSDAPAELIVNNTWRPTLAATGAEGLPALKDAGNVLLPSVAMKLSFRLPPTCDPAMAARAVKDVLEADPPYGAEVAFQVGSSLGGWNAPALDPWLVEAMQRASREAFGRDVMYMGTGGSIPFIGMLADRYPGVQFLVTGVLGPNSNAHGPNEFLHLECARRVTLCAARVLADHASRRQARVAA